MDENTIYNVKVFPRSDDPTESYHLALQVPSVF